MFKHLWIIAALALFLPGRTLQAATWIPSGPDGGDARRFVADPNDPKHLYLGAANGWIYQSTDGGDRWQRVARVGKRDDLVIDSIVVDPGNAKHLVVGAWVLDHSDGGVFTTRDGGTTWVNQPDMKGQSVLSLSESRSDPTIFVAGSLKGVFRSEDAGEHWKQISPVDSTEIHNVESVAIDPVDPKVIYAGTWHLPWKTSDGGEHWENIKEGIIDDSDVFSIIVDPKSPAVVYASACSGIYKSENAGALFHKVQGIPSTARRTRVLLQDPNHLDVVFAGTTEGLFRSTDAGKTWTRTTGPELIVNDVVIDRADSRRVLIATDRAGVLASEDGGDSFKGSNAGFSARQVTAVQRDEKDPRHVYVGMVNDKEWGGVYESTDGGGVWQQLSQGLDSRDVFALGQAADGSLIAGTPHGFYRMTGADKTWVHVRDAMLPEHPQPKEEPAAVRKQMPARRSAHASSSRRKSKSARAKGTRTSAAHKPVAAAKTEPKVAAPVQSSFDGEVFGFATIDAGMLAITSDGLAASRDAGTTWTSTHTAGSQSWRMIAAARENVVASSAHELAFSADAGSSWAVIPLPAELTRIATVAVEPSGHIWVGGPEGAFVTTDGGQDWSRPKNLFATFVRNIFYDEATNRVLVAAGEKSSTIFTMQLQDHKVTYTDSGWDLRLTRPVGDYLLGVTLFDGVVLQPRMVDSPFSDASTAKPKGQ